MYDWNMLKNYRLWLAIFALIPLVLEGFNLSILPSNYNEIVTLILSILVMGGILNNPNTDKVELKDDKASENCTKKITSSEVEEENK
ncbi:hypothetical protein P5F04_06370 [Clostridium perfringens]|uniref:hypothetical protein n=1 Tax=Clostridium perfringens TaxID=1502 RepID=UPI0011224AC1|nr:hypothetical protein [Clostridium perfringens]EGT3600433.1 hypothetical protein [Clostridium perfringens]EGT5620196.1 hypothetical protein [Clostridium perfringens]MDK0537741.1 hypothetical protein [Clostridium perfringens]MDK0564040.1 hypothetical protein [Clostridium perfringens]MDK0570583.1 hypothetical protein [Clostridium perfringens]